MAGSAVFFGAGGGEVTTAVGSEAASVDPTEFSAVTTTRRVRPTSPEATL